MLMASFEVQAAVSAVANRWEKQASTHMAALERAYAGEQEAEYAASLAEYYAARQQHQAEQQRLNQVLYGHVQPGAQMFLPRLELSFPPAQQQAAAAQHAPAALPQRHDSAMDECGGGSISSWQGPTAASPRLPLAAVSNMQWEAAAAVAISRKRAYDAAVAGWQQQPCDGAADPASKRRPSFRS